MATDKSDVLYGSLGLMVLKTLEAIGPLHGYRIARRIEQISLTMNTYSHVIEQLQDGAAQEMTAILWADRRA